MKREARPVAVGYNGSTMQQPTFQREEHWINSGYCHVIGIDEAGRGPLAGPVVAAAARYRHADFVIPENMAKDFALIRDSKTLSEKQRERIFDFIHEHFHIGIGVMSAATIDRVNVLQATFLAMKAALTVLKKQLTASSQQKSKDEDIFLLVDGNQVIPHISIKQEAVIGGDGRVVSIAAASIIAKVTRDRMMMDFHKRYPSYGFDRHKGYGTSAHMDALRAHGSCPIHRKSFGPVAYIAGI